MKKKNRSSKVEEKLFKEELNNYENESDREADLVRQLSECRYERELSAERLNLLFRKQFTPEYLEVLISLSSDISCNDIRSKVIEYDDEGKPKLVDSISIENIIFCRNLEEKQRELNNYKKDIESDSNSLFRSVYENLMDLYINRSDNSNDS